MRNPFDRDTEPEAFEEWQREHDAEINDREEYPPENEPDGPTDDTEDDS